MIYTQDDLKREIQIDRCKAAIAEYFKGQAISVDYKQLYAKLDPHPLLFQFAHCISFLKMNWRDALRFCIERKDEIIMHSVIDLNNEKKHEEREMVGLHRGPW